MAILTPAALFREPPARTVLTGPAAAAPTAAARTLTGAAVGVVLLCAVALAPITFLHVWASDAVDPVLVPISCYALIPGGGYLLLLAACCLLSGSGVALAWLLHRSGLPGMRLPVGILLSFAVAFVLVGLFPTVPFKSHLPSVSADIHRVCATWGVVCVPAVAALVGRARRATTTGPRPVLLVRLAAVVGLLIALFLAIHLPLFLLTGNGIPAFGLLERFGFAAIIASLVLTGAMVAADARRRSVPHEEAAAGRVALRESIESDEFGRCGQSVRRVGSDDRGYRSGESLVRHHLPHVDLARRLRRRPRAEPRSSAGQARPRAARLAYRRPARDRGRQDGRPLADAPGPQ